MENVKILIPLDGTERSMHSINWLKKMFNKDNTEITVMNIIEIVITNDMVVMNEFGNVQEESELILDKAIKELEGYKVEKFTALGNAGDEILRKAKAGNYDIIIMTKSNKKGLARMVGSVTSKVVKNAQSLVMVVPQ
ncbi:universal stress protein [Clostridium sp. DJ247]|uniref:universal stress protein n=1 Tax=Clostridium sp. DJ247 TaxID=2726188 RepID=UPI0016270D66|nr:universal stress protein [Clostridium sp. DJ247]MBC2580471.1 universal stress protein [Clostridium sp. DJ247]